MKEKIILYTDGGSRGNPGISGAGFVITDEQGVALQKGCKFLGVVTNNEAEYLAVIEGLTLLKKFLGQNKSKQYEVELRLDSQLVANQLIGDYQIKEERLFPLFIKVWNLQVKDVPKLKVTYIPREQNKLADDLANQAMDSAK